MFRTKKLKFKNVKNGSNGHTQRGTSNLTNFKKIEEKTGDSRESVSRANIETSAAKTRRSRIIFLLISVGEEFVVFHLLHFYTEDRSFAEVKTSIYRRNDSIFSKTLAVEQPS